MSDDAPRIGLVDGSADSDSRRFFLVLEPDALVQLDELVAVTTPLAGGKKVTHYGIVTEITSRLEGTEFPSDTARFADRTLPASMCAGPKCAFCGSCRRCSCRRTPGRRPFAPAATTASSASQSSSRCSWPGGEPGPGNGRAAEQVVAPQVALGTLAEALRARLHHEETAGRRSRSGSRDACPTSAARGSTGSSGRRPRQP